MKVSFKDLDKNKKTKKNTARFSRQIPDASDISKKKWKELTFSNSLIK